MSVALIVIYNHRYEQNIRCVESIYKRRFNNLFHVIPFYEGTIDNVLSVYESSFYFSGYIAQAHNILENKGLKFDHYFFIADDMILNPSINENNYMTLLGIEKEHSFISNMIDLTKISLTDWNRCVDAFDFDLARTGIEVTKILPTIEEASIKFDKLNISWNKFGPKFYELNPNHFENLDNLKNVKKKLLSLNITGFSYPLAGGYSDILIIPSKIITKFSLYCGVFAAANLFVEVAIPTSLILSSDHIKTESDIHFKTGAMWSQDDFLSKYTYNHDKLKNHIISLNKSLHTLLEEFPQEYLFVHPIKLSQWIEKRL